MGSDHDEPAAPTPTTTDPTSSATHDPASDQQTQWIPLPDVADILGVPVGQVRRMLQDRVLVAVRRGANNVLCVPADLLLDAAPLPDLKGTLTVLADSGFDDEEAVRWLLAEDPSLPGSPASALRAGRKTEIRRRAQSLAF